MLGNDFSVASVFFGALTLLDRADAEVLLAHVLRVDRGFLYAHPERILTLDEYEAFEELVRRRGEPVAYRVGHKAFWSFDLRVTPDVLIPRPETELLVEAVLSGVSFESAFPILDLGTGSGAIALALALERPRATVFGVDISLKALAVARSNAERLGLSEIRWIQSDWWEGLSGQQFDVIVSNPPYVEEGARELEEGDIRFEPRGALVSGADGLDALRIVISGAVDHLRSGGYLWVEHSDSQAEAVRTLFHNAGFTLVETRKDLLEWQRITGGMFESSVTAPVRS